MKDITRYEIARGKRKGMDERIIKGRKTKEKQSKELSFLN